MIHYSVFRASDSDEMVRLLAETFTRRDPPALAVAVDAHEFEVLARLYCPKADGEGLTIVARSAQTGEMVGALLAEDSASPPPQDWSRISDKFLPIFDILGAVETAYQRGNTPSQPAAASRPFQGESLHLFLLGADARFSGQGIAHQLVARCIANGMSKGYRLAVAEATNRTSQHIFRKQGFAERAHISYRDYRFHGRPVFESIASEGSLILMDKSLLPVPASTATLAPAAL